MPEIEDVIGTIENNQSGSNSEIQIPWADSEHKRNSKIEDIPAQFVELLTTINTAKMVRHPTYIAWRTGVSDLLLSKVLLPLIENESAHILIPALRSLWLTELKNVEIRQINIDIRQFSNSTDLDLPFDDILAPLSYPITVINSTPPNVRFRVLHHLTNQIVNNPIGIFSKNQKPMILLIEILGTVDKGILQDLLYLLQGSVNDGITLWLHAHLQHTPKLLLDQFSNHIVLLPSIADLNIMEQFRIVPIELKDEKKSRIALLSGPCVNRLRSYIDVPLNLFGDLLDLNSDKSRENYFRSVVAIFLQDAHSNPQTNVLPVGTGFLVIHLGNLYVVSCAHVFTRNKITKGASVTIVPTLGNGCKATVSWLDVPDETELNWNAKDDIALLKVEDSQCENYHYLELARETGTDIDNCYCFAYVSTRASRGAWIDSISCRQRINKGFVELSQHGNQRLSNGASGAPLSDPNGNVLGMIQSVYEKDIAYLTPSSIILEVISLSNKELI